MSDQPPDFLPYESRTQPNRPNGHNGRAWLFVWAGLLGGAALSGVVWPLVFFKDMSFDWFLPAIVAMLAVKLVGSGILMTLRSRVRYIGMGLLISLALGGLIFFCTCGASFSNALRH